MEIISMPLGARRLALHGMAFDAALFSTAAFAESGIACPPPIARSVRKRQAEYFHGRLAARAALSAVNVIAGSLMSAPDGAPIWPDGVVGSISHSSHLAIAAVVANSNLRGLGIDVESIIDVKLLESILALVLDAREQELLRTLDSIGQLPFPTAVTLAFSAKESFYKAVSAVAGRVLEFDAIQITGIDGDATGGRLYFETSEVISKEWHPGRRGQVDFIALTEGELVTAFGW